MSIVFSINIEYDHQLTIMYNILIVYYRLQIVCLVCFAYFELTLV